MKSEMAYVRELSTLDFRMNEIDEQKTASGDTENLRIGRLFYWLAAAQIVQIPGAAILGFFIAPASLFVSRGENEAFAWIIVGFAGFALIALGALLIVLSIVAARAFYKEKSRRKFIGILTIVLALFAFPFGTILGAALLLKIFKNAK